MSAREQEKDIPGVVMLPPYIFLIVLITGLALNWLLPMAFLGGFSFASVQGVIGMVLCTIGGVSAAWGIATFMQAGTNIPPDEPALLVVTNGPYRFTRNPMYLGMLFLLAGLGLLFSIEWLLLLWLPFLAVMHVGVVKREERYMEHKFGEEYLALLESTRRWI